MMMKGLRLFWLIGCLLLWGGGLSAFSIPDDYNPENPPDPTVIDYCRLTVSATPAEGAYVSGGGKYVVNGGQIYVSASARNTDDYTYTFEYWSLNGEQTSYNQNFWFTPQKGKFELVAHFKKSEVVFDPDNPADPSSAQVKRRYYLYLSSSISGACSFSMDSGTKIEEGRQVCVSVSPNGGYEFEGWKVDGQTVCTDLGYKFTMPSAHTTLQACLKEIPFDPENPADPSSQSVDVDNTSRQIVEIGIGGSTGAYVDKTRVVVNDLKTSGYDTGTDAAKFISNGTNYQIYSLDASQTRYSVNERPKSAANTSLGIIAKTAGTAKISVIRLDCSAMLIDKVTGVSHDLALGDYTFTTGIGTIEDRFVLLAPAVFQIGDANCDGSVDIADAVVIVNHVVGKPTPSFYFNAADVNSDGAVDIADAVRIVNKLVGKIASLVRGKTGNSNIDPE